MKSRFLIAGAAVIAVIALAGGGAYVYFFSGLRSSPSALGLSASPCAQASSTPSASASGSLAGSCTATTGSIAGYRVMELFVGETSKHEAVARTSSVSGSLTVAGDSSGYQVSAITITAVLTGLHSVDTVAGRDVSQRDGFVSRQMNLQQFPDAGSTSGPVDVTLPGKLTIHGVTKVVTATAKAQVSGSKVEVAGSVSIVMTDYGITPPSVPFTTVDPQVTIEFDVFLTKAA